MGEGVKAAAGQQWFTTSGRQPLITRTPMEMSMDAAAKRAGVKPAKRLTAKQELAMRKAEVALRAELPPIPASDYDHYLRFGG